MRCDAMRVIGGKFRGDTEGVVYYKKKAWWRLRGQDLGLVAGL